MILIPEFPVTGEEEKRAQGSVKPNLGSFNFNIDLLMGVIYFFFPEKDATTKKKKKKQIAIMKKTHMYKATQML